MRYIFIVNPAAGKHKKALTLLPSIQAYFSAHFANSGSVAYKIRITEGAGHAREIVTEESRTEEEVRFIVCGGDGTLGEAAAGIACAQKNKDSIALGCIPCGSANDFIRSFPEAGDFRNLDSLLNGTIRLVDGIRSGDKTAINLCSMGMDADVANKMVKYKRLPLVSGSMAYQIAIADVFCHPIGKNLRVVMDTPAGVVEETGRFFFALAASGQYYGGGYRGAPQAVVDDGLLDFVLVRAMPRLKIPGFLKRYKPGEHIGMDGCSFYRGTGMRVFCEDAAVVNLDGECFSAAEVSFEVVPGAFRFLLPAKE